MSKSRILSHDKINLFSIKNFVFVANATNIHVGVWYNIKNKIKSEVC